MNEPAPESAAETWTYGGIRAGRDGKNWHAWLDAAGEEHWLARTSGRMAVGSHYTAQVTRRDDEGYHPARHPRVHRVPSRPGNPRHPVDRAHPGPDPDRVPARQAGRRPPQCPGRGPRPARGTGRPAAHRRAARRPCRLRHPQASRHLEHPVAGKGKSCDYLISGEFRVHRDGCRDCEKEARRSDSPGNAEEYASRAEVIASLWPDIIAGNPGRYGTPGGFASLEAETIFLPCTSGLPGTTSPAGPAEDGARPGDAAGDWQDIYLRDKDGGTDVMFDGGVMGWPVPVTDGDLRLLLTRLLERAGARYEVRGDDGQFTSGADPDGQPFTAQAAAGYAWSLNAEGSGTYRVMAVVPLET